MNRGETNFSRSLIHATLLETSNCSFQKLVACYTQQAVRSLILLQNPVCQHRGWHNYLTRHSLMAQLWIVIASVMSCHSPTAFRLIAFRGFCVKISSTYVVAWLLRKLPDIFLWVSASLHQVFESGIPGNRHWGLPFLLLRFQPLVEHNTQLHKPDICFVYSHSKTDGCNNNWDLLLHPFILNWSPVSCLEPWKWKKMKRNKIKQKKRRSILCPLLTLSHCNPLN